MNAVLAEKIGPNIDDLDAIRDLFIWEGSNVREAVESSWCNLGRAMRYELVNTSVVPWAERLLAYVRDEFPTVIDFRVDWLDAETGQHIFRGHRSHTVGGPLLALRRIPLVTPSLDELALPRWWRELFLQKEWALKGGLLLMSAPTGSGKSTTIAAVIKSRLQQFGGHTRTAEDPIELPLHGFVGNGICIQHQVDAADPALNWETTLHGMMRSYPASSDGASTLFVGEARDETVAVELIRAAVNGHLVITTIHASDCASSIQRLVALAAVKMGDDMASGMVAQALRMVVHQRLVDNPNPRARGWQSKVVAGDILLSDGPTHPVAVTISSKEYRKLGAAVSSLSNKLGNRDPKTTSVEDLIAETKQG